MRTPAVMIMRDDNLEKKNHHKIDTYTATLTKIFTIAQWFGIPTYGNKISICWTIIIFGMLATIEAVAIMNIVQHLTGLAIHVDDRGFVPRLSGSIFYANALLSLILSWRFISLWRTLSFFWKRTEVADAYLPQDKRIKRRMIFVTYFVAVCAVVEHSLSMVSATGFDCPPSEYFQRYILSSHGFLLRPEDYNLETGIPIFFLSKIATILWNFQDLIIILISLGLSSRYYRLNNYVNKIVTFENTHKEFDTVGLEKYIRGQQWRRIRQAYVRQAALVRMVDSNIGPLILLSNINNFYFICLQLFLGLNKSQGAFINSIYYFISLGWLIFRACTVVLAAADVHVHSKRAIQCLNSCPGAGYNIEVKRLNNQLINDYVALSGMGFFWLDRQTLLEVVGNIIKYELVMIQYDK